MRKWLLVSLLLSFPVLAADPGAYMSVDFTRSDYIPTDGLVADWQLDAMVEGDLTQGNGDMESGSASGGCTYCPTGFVCTCAGTSNVTQENSKVYKNNSSAKYTVDALDSVITILYPFYAEANTAYQINWKHKGNAGGEDFYIQLNDIPANSYNFTTDAWQVGASAITYAALPTSWTTTNLYFVNDATARTAYFRIVRNNANFTYFFDDFQIRKLKNTGPKSRAGQYTLQVPVTSDMRFGDSPNLLSKPADGPAGSNGTWFDGTTDYLTCPDAICGWADPTNAFSVASEFNYTVDGVHVFAGKYGVVTQGWLMYRLGGADRFYVCKAGAVCITTAAPVSSTANTNNIFIGTWEQIADGSSLQLGQLNHNAPTTSAVSVAPVLNTNDDFTIGSIAGGGSCLNGFIKRFSFYNKRLDTIDISKWISPYFPANNNNRGSYVTTCTQAASHATCSATKCRNGTPNACQAEATGAMAIFGQNTELVPYNSFETVVNDDSNPLFTGYSSLSVNGDGASSVTAYRDETKHGNVAVRLKSSGSTAYSAVSTVCIPVTPATAYYAYVSAKQLGGMRTNMFLRLVEYSDGACVTSVAQTDLFTGSIDSSFSVRKPTGAITTNVATNSAIIAVVNFGAYAAATPTFTGTATSDILVDAISLKAASYFTPFVHNPGAGTTTYNWRDYRIRNTLADPTMNGLYPYQTGFCAAAWIYTDRSGAQFTTNRFAFSSPSVAGANGWYLRLESGNYLTAGVQDSAGVWLFKYLATDATNWSGSNWHYAEMCSDNTGTVKGHWFDVASAAWYNLSSSIGGGTGIQNAQSTTLNIGSEGTTAFDGYISQLCIKPWNAIYPNCGFNSGVPPALGTRPY